MDRRGFLTSILAAAAAPAIVRADSLMRVVRRDTTIVGVDPGSVSVNGWTISYDGGETWRTYYMSGDSVVIQPGNAILRSPWIQFYEQDIQRGICSLDRRDRRQQRIDPRSTYSDERGMGSVG